MSKCPHDDLDVGFDDDGEPIHVICAQCHGLWPVVKVKPAQVAMDLLRLEPEPEASGLTEKIARAQTAVAFLASVIKAGEPWSDDCEEAVREALA